jgi:hypothetical protein
MIPGSNLLKTALRVISSQTVSYQEFTGRTTNAAGLKVSAYADAVDIRGSFQPVDRSYYLQLGLDFTKSYAKWYDPNATTRDIQRDTSGDRITYAGMTYNALSNNEWKAPDGWTGTMFVRVPS